MLPQAADRIAATVPDDALVLQVGASAGAFERADWVLDDREHDPHGGARFTRRTWITRDVSGREPWPFPDDRFAFAVCTVLADLRDPVGVCAELARVARAGYVELPTVEAELADGDARWLCDVAEGGLVFTRKPAAAYTDVRLRALSRRGQDLPPERRVLALFWEDVLPARERLVDDSLVGDLRERLRATFGPIGTEVVLGEARRSVEAAGAAALRRLADLRGLR